MDATADKAGMRYRVLSWTRRGLFFVLSISATMVTAR